MNADLTRFSERARDLRLDPRATGDHGFRGQQLRTWFRMRETFDAALSDIEIGKDVPNWYRDPNCPAMVDVGPTDPGDERTFFKTHGTQGGAEWADNCRYLIADVKAWWQRRDERYRSVVWSLENLRQVLADHPDTATRFRQEVEVELDSVKDLEDMSVRELDYVVPAYLDEDEEVMIWADPS